MKRMDQSRRSGMGILLLAALLTGGGAQAQTGSLELRRLRWPLLDIVMVPDSGGMWFMAAPNPSTTHWESDDYLVRFGIDPVLALQWAMVARKLVSASTQTQPNQPVPLTPRLPASKGGPAYVVLAANPKKKPPVEERFILLASDSAADIRWKSFLSASQVGDFLTALEATAGSSREAHPAYWRTVTDPDPDIPVRVVSQPRPVFPERLASRGRVGRVWMSFVVTADGRADSQSFFTLLSDDSLFTESARQALLRGRYRPATTDNQPVPQRVVQAILFRQR